MKKKLKLEDLKVESFVPLLEKELQEVAGGITQGACTDDFNCNSDFGGSRFQCCSNTCDCSVPEYWCM